MKFKNSKKFRLEITLGIVLMLIITSYSVLSVTRTITDSSDTIETYIRNSNGKYWAVDGTADDVQIQAAIDDIGSYGSVWVGCNTTISSPLTLDDNDHITLDFEEHQVTLDGDIEFINLSSTSCTTVENVKVLPTEYHTSPILVIYVGNTGSKYNTFSNIGIGHHDSHWIPGVGWAEHNFTGIKIHLAGTGSALRNTFNGIEMSGVYNGILLYQEDTASGNSYGNGNYFEDVYIDLYVNCINFTIYDGTTFHFNQNVFNHVKSQTAKYSEYGIKNVSGNGNHFDHCLMWDWSYSDVPIYEWWFGVKSYYTIVDNLHNYDDDYILNEGVSTVMSGVGGSNLLVEDFVQPHDITIFTDGTDYFKKDGITGVVETMDDANNAFEEAILDSNGGSIYVREGVYEIHEMIAQNGQSENITFIGESKYNTIIRAKSGSNLDIMFNIGRDSGVTFRDLTFDGNYVSPTNGANDTLYISTQGATGRFSNWTVDNCIFMNAGDEALVMRCYSGDSLTNVRVTNCDFWNIADRCMYIWGTSTGQINNSFFMNNYMENVDEGMYLEYVDHSKITGNTMIGVLTTGINMIYSENNTVMMNDVSGVEGIDELAGCAWNMISWNNVGGCTTGIADGDGVDSQIVNNMGDDLP